MNTTSMTCVTFIQNDDPAQQKAYRVRENELNIVGDFRELSDKHLWDIAHQVIENWGTVGKLALKSKVD